MTAERILKWVDESFVQPVVSSYTDLPSACYSAKLSEGR